MNVRGMKSMQFSCGVCTAEIENAVETKLSGEGGITQKLTLYNKTKEKV